MLAFVPVWFLIIAMILENIKLDKKSQEEYEQWRNKFWNKH